MPHLINSETGKVYPFPPSEDNGEDMEHLHAWRAMVTLIDQGRASYDPTTDSLQLIHG